MPKVSIIIPVYGVEKYIERCARSLFEQTLDCIEYIFVDDCSPDKSIEILERIIEEYRPRFAGERKVVQIERMLTNSGQAAVRKHPINSHHLSFPREAGSIFFDYTLQYIYRFVR